MDVDELSSTISDTCILLRDGRRLAYAEYGDQAGAPVLLFHGLPGSRLSWGLPPETPSTNGSTGSG